MFQERWSGRVLRALIRYGAALAIGMCAVLLRLALDPVLGGHVPYTIIYLSVTLSGYLFGFGPGVATVAICDILLDFYVLRPQFSMFIADFADQVGFLLFNIESLTICVIIASLQLTRRELEQALQDADKQRDRAEMLRHEAERANAAKDLFLGMISHELRSPINSLVLMPPLLRSGHALSEKSEKVARIIERSTVALRQMVEDLVDSTRIVSGQLQLSVKLLDVVKVVDGAIDLMRGPAEAEGLELVRVVGSAPLPVFCDEGRLREAICNLVGNSIKFSSSGRITVSVEGGSRDIEIAVADNGDGIEPEMLTRIFDRFVQERKNSGRKGGLGLGLFIVKNVVELHGGTIRAFSRGKGQGSKFVMILPSASVGEGFPR